MKLIFNIFIISILISLISCSDKTSTSEDWPQFKNDNFRSGISVVNLDLKTLDKKWTYVSAQEPAPAWYGPAYEDAYAKSGPLPSMRDYDLAYYPIIVGDNLYYSSSSDDAVHCINTSNGIEKWRFTTEGPIRIAPVFYKGKLFFGSDDGFVYCIDADNAKQKWKYSPSPNKDRLVLHNGRLISFWPIRTGVLLENDKVYFGASLLPWKKSYFCAINAGNGSPDGKGCYVREMNNMTFEGAMASTGSMLIQPQGRIAPAFFNKIDGKHKGSLPGTGGCFVLVTNDKHVVHYQNSRFKSIDEYVDKAEPEYMSFKGGKEMVIKGDTSFILTDNSLSAYHRKDKKLIWLRRDYNAHRLILSGNTLYVGATDTVYAVSIENGLPLWKGLVEGTVYALATANNALYASTGEGTITCFRSGGKVNTLFQLNQDKPAYIDELTEDTTKLVPNRKLVLKAGPFAHALSKDSVRITFEMATPTAIDLIWTASGYQSLNYKLPTKRSHSVDLSIRKNFSYTYTLTAKDSSQGIYKYDNFFNYKHKKVDFSNVKPINTTLQSKISEIVNDMEIKSGLCLVIGLDNLETPIEIARNSDFDVIILDDTRSSVDDMRNKLQDEDVYGRKISALKIQDLNNIPVTSELANLVFLNTESEVKADEIIRLIAPGGIAIVYNVTDNWLKNSSLDWQVDTQKSNEDELILTKLPFENTGDWTHQYASPDNSAFGGESLYGSTRSEDFEVQWMGRPGPRFQTDRSGRKPSPLAINGRMFVQGSERIIAVDVYNGNILWSKDFSGFIRMNIHRDCSNWAADDNYLYLAIGHNLIKVDQKTGSIVETIPDKYEQSNWGYISIVDNIILGSSVPEGSNFIDYHGGTGWYDTKGGPMAFKVISKALFALDNNGDSLWTYKPGGVIINPTITVYNHHICFVESDGVILSKDGRGGNDLFKSTWLIALNINSGKQVWKRRIKTMPGITMYSMAAGNGKYVIVSSHNWKYEIYAYNANNGDLIWQKEQRWFHGDHGGHLSRPAIANNRLVVKPAIYKLETGERQTFNMPKSGHGCASYALTEQAIFYRGGSVTQFNFDTREFSRWERLRPDCWISTIPAQGMVLSPEGGGGCSCGNWLETSMVMAPVSRAPITIRTTGDVKPEYKQETWGEYTQSYLPNEFLDSVKVEIIMKPGVNGNIHYTINGSNPTQNSPLYSTPLILNQNATLNAAVFIEKSGKTRKFIRTKSFIRLRPTPSVEMQRKVTKGTLQVLFNKTGKTGTIYYTTDGTDPDSNSNKVDGPLTIKGNTTIKARTIWVENGDEYRSEIVSRDISVPDLTNNTIVKVNPGIRYEYYEGMWKKLPDFDKLELVKEGYNPVFDVTQRNRNTRYGFRYTGYINILVDGIYTFYTTSDDGSSLWLHNIKLIDNDGNHTLTEKKNNIPLKAGLHPITVLYFQLGGNQDFTVEIEGPGMERQIVSSDMLFHE